MSHNFPAVPIPLQRDAVEEICSSCGCRSWRYKDGTRWMQLKECAGDPQIGPLISRNSIAPGIPVEVWEENLKALTHGQ